MTSLGLLVFMECSCISYAGNLVIQPNSASNTKDRGSGIQEKHNFIVPVILWPITLRSLSLGEGLDGSEGQPMGKNVNLLSSLFASASSSISMLCAKHDFSGW